MEINCFDFWNKREGETFVGYESIIITGFNYFRQDNNFPHKALENNGEKIEKRRQHLTYDLKETAAEQ